MKFPILASKFDDSNDHNAIIYTTDNLAYRGVQPFMTTAEWGRAWSLECFANMFVNGTSVGDMIDTGIFPVSFFKNAHDEMLRHGLIDGKLDSMLFSVDMKTGNQLIMEKEFDDILQHGGLAAKAVDKATADLIAASEMYSYVDYWDVVRELCMYAANNYAALGKMIKNLQGQRKYEKDFAEIMNTILRPVNNYYLYLYGIYKHHDNFYIIHCCCLAGNEIIEVYPDGKILIRDRGQELRVNPIINDMILQGSKVMDGYKIEENLRLPFDISDMVNDYDCVVSRYTRAS